METLVETLREALASFVAFLPALVAGLLVLLIGWIVAAVLRRIVRAVLPRTGLDRLLARFKIIERAPDTRAGSNIVASAVFWAVILIALMQAANIWGLQFVATGLGRVIEYLPNVVAAVLVFGAAVLVGGWVRDRLRSRDEVQQLHSTFLPEAIRAGILTIGAFVALRQLDIASEILVIGFSLVFGAIALATALAFGLGGRRTVERMTQDWYDRQRTRRAITRTGERTGIEEPGPAPGI